jgi:hypothetical protein
MAAGLGFKTFTTGEVLTSADVNGYLMQGVLVFASEAARDAAITSPQEGQFAFTKDNNSLWYYSGAAWVASGATGDIEGVTAGTGISGGGTSGTVTITNSMATEIDAQGDLVVGTGADTFARLAVGANDTVLTADSAEATGLKWAAPAAGGGMTLVETLSISGASTTSSSIAGTYKNLYIIVKNAVASTNTDFYLRFNSDSGSNYVANKVTVVAASTISGGGNTAGTTEIRLSDIGTDSTALGKCTGTFTVNRYADTDQTFVTANFYVLEGSRKATYINGIYDQSAAITTLTLGVLSGTVTGTAYIYGVS